MHRFERYFAVAIIIAMMFLVNTVNIAFSSMLLREAGSAQKFSTDRDSVLHPTQPNSGYHSSPKKMDNGKPERSFQNFWELDAFKKNTCFDGIEEHGDFAYIDEDSVELVIGVNNAEREAYANLIDEISKSQGEIVNTVSIRGKVIAVVADIPLNAISSFTEKVQTSNLARYIEPNMKVQAQFVPNDPYWSWQWGPQKIEADWAWNTTIGDPSVLVAVVDTGIDYTHPDLEANYVSLGYDWVNLDEDPLDDFGHGTHCAGIISAVLNNSIGIAGLAQVQIMAEKVLDSWGWGYWDWVASGIIHATDCGADIISMSLGGYGDSELVHEAVRYAYDCGVLVVAAAGNDNTNMKLYPAGYDEVIAVAATDEYDNKAWWSNWGDWIELAGPGVSIYSTMPTYYVTLNDRGYSMDYDYMSGTSMACPHVAGVAALVWSLYPNKTRDWVRLWLRYTADDLGAEGFDIYYGYGRVNARKAVEQTPPAHELVAYEWRTPPYVEPEALGIINATILNFGENNETDIMVQLFANGTMVNSASIDFLAGGNSTTVSLAWNPTVEGLYNVTLYVVPVFNETSLVNNVLSKYIYVGFPVKAVVLHSAGNVIGNIITNWQVLNSEWRLFGDTMIYIDYTTLNKEDIAYEDIVATEADILIISCAFDPYSGWEFTDSEIEAIERYVHEGHGLIATAGTLYYWVPNNNKLAPLFGLNETTMWDATGTDLLHLLNVNHPLFGNVPDPFVFTYVGTAIPFDWRWDSNELVEGEYLAVGQLQESAIVTFRGLIYISPWLEIIPAYYHHHLQLLYNAIIWSHYQKPEHELVVSLEAPKHLQPSESVVLNATVSNMGLNNETDVELYLLIDDGVVNNVTISELVNGTSYTINHTWIPSAKGTYNVTAYAPPVPGENVTLNNVKTKYVHVQHPLINPVEGQYANYILCYYDSSGYLIGTGYWNFTYDYYVEPYKIYITVWYKDPSGYTGTDWMIVNTMNRFVESGVWAGLWYTGWIETNITIGSTINLLYGTATVNGSTIIIVGARAIDCWELSYSEYGYQYSFWYDKASGLWVGMEYPDPYSGGRVELLLVDTNVPIGTQYEHDLGVTLDTPRYLQPGETSVLNATVYNLGLNNETSVEIQILINDTQVASETLDELTNGTWYTINYSWTPTTKGIYNITAYVPPVPDENVAINNIASRMVCVRYVEVALISAYLELMTITPILDSMGIGYDVYNDNDMYLYTEDLNLLLKYKAVIFYNRYRWITSTEYLTLESYLSSGGNLLVTGYDCLVSDRLLAELVRSSSIGDNVGEYDLIVVDDTHPIMDGPYGSFPAGYHIYGLYCDCDSAEADTTRGAVTVAELWDGYDKIIATEGLPGKVVFWNGDGRYDWTWNSDCEAMFKNLIHWFTVRYEHELVVFLQAPNFLEPGDSTMLNATVQNQGLNNETNVELQLLINGTMVESITLPQLLTEESYTISHLWTPTLAGTYNITVYAPPVPDENITRNNLYSKMIPVQYAPRILAYIQYTDYYQDYRNTLRAIESAFGPNYILTELWDYTQLDSMLVGKDILLIPDQEYTSLYMMEMIGEVWSETLAEFLENGGIIILCDGFRGYGGTYGILTGAELMSISYTNYRSYYTLYLVDPSDPLAEGVSSSFVAPYYTVSFVTQETNVVIEDDWHYPVVIHKEIGRGHIALLGFDFESSNVDTEQLLGNAVTLAAYITISVNPSAGSLGTEVTVSGTKATANGTVAIYWDDIFLGNATADEVGDFMYLLTVPLNATVGVHEIMAIDTVTGRVASTPFKVIFIALNPTEGPIGTKVTVNGAGFPPESQVTITFNDMLIGYTTVDSFGNFTFTSNIPFSTADRYHIKAFDAEGNYARETFTVIDVTPLGVQIDVGAMHFRGELVEFYSQIVFKGTSVNATNLSAVLYGPNGETVGYHYPENITLITTGFYKISYIIPRNASTGTYTLVINANYIRDIVRANGTSFKCFQISPALENIFVKVIAINGTTAIIQTTLGIMNGTITSIKGDIATIVIPGVGQIETDISSLKGTQETWIIPQYVIIIVALIAAASSTLSVIFLRRKKTAKTE